MFKFEKHRMKNTFIARNVKPLYIYTQGNYLFPYNAIAEF